MSGTKHKAQQSLYSLGTSSPPLDLDTHLLQAPISSSSNECQNDTTRHPLKTPPHKAESSQTISSSSLRHKTFLNDLGHHCIASAIRDCQNKACVERRHRMDKAVPTCQWSEFRRWALVSMSCLVLQQDESSTSTWTANDWADPGGPARRLHDVLDRCVDKLDNGSAQSNEDFSGILRGKTKNFPVDLFAVCEVIYWIWQALQGWRGLPTWDVPKVIWDANFLPQRAVLPVILEASNALSALSICRKRVWNLINASERQQVDLPAFIDLALHLRLDQERRHQQCTEELCRFDDDNSTIVKQLHKCRKDTCFQIVFPPAELDHAVHQDLPPAWTIAKYPKVNAQRGEYLAISHLWADGTGIGLKKPGEVNSCLVEFFNDIAKMLNCSGIWWDTICVPTERKARQKAMNRMHENYKQARCTVVHDKSLIEFDWREDGSPCLALVLSPWFSRGWTALELYMSEKVVVLFKDPKAKSGMPVIKDLDEDVLAVDNVYAHPAHRLASAVIQRLRPRMQKQSFNVHTLLAVLQPRSTSWAKDQMLIAGLMAELPDFDSTDSRFQITEKILARFGWIKASSLLHDHAMPNDSGPWSWCPTSLYDIRSDSTIKFAELDVHQDGVAIGWWHCAAVSKDDAKRFRPHSSYQSVRLRILNALQRPQHCLILRPIDGPPNGTLNLLVTTVGCDRDRAVRDRAGGLIIHCRYIGTIARPIYQEDFKKFSDKTLVRVSLGADQDKNEIDAQQMIRNYESQW